MTRLELDRALLELRAEILGGRHSGADRLELHTKFWKRTDRLIAEAAGDDRIHAREVLNDLLSAALTRGVFDLSCAETQASPPAGQAWSH